MILIGPACKSLIYIDQGDSFLWHGIRNMSSVSQPWSLPMSQRLKENQPLDRKPEMSSHAEIRMQQRGIQRTDIELAIQYGRRIHAKGLTYYVIERKEVK